MRIEKVQKKKRGQFEIEERKVCMLSMSGGCVCIFSEWMVVWFFSIFLLFGQPNNLDTGGLCCAGEQLAGLEKHRVGNRQLNLRSTTRRDTEVGRQKDIENDHF